MRAIAPSPPRAAPDLGWAHQPRFYALYASTPPTAVLLATVADAPSRGEGGRGPAALKRLDSGRRGGRGQFAPSIYHHTAANPLSSAVRITAASASVSTKGGDRMMFGPDTRTIAPDS